MSMHAIRVLALPVSAQLCPLTYDMCKLLCHHGSLHFSILHLICSFFFGTQGGTAKGPTLIPCILIIVYSGDKHKISKIFLSKWLFTVNSTVLLLYFLQNQVFKLGRVAKSICMLTFRQLAAVSNKHHPCVQFSACSYGSMPTRGSVQHATYQKESLVPQAKFTL